MHSSPDTQKRILHRLKITKGHLDKVIRMVEDDAYCIDVLHQSRAVQKALKETDNVIFTNHLQTCVKNQIKDGNTQIVDELTELFEKRT